MIVNLSGRRTASPIRSRSIALAIGFCLIQSIFVACAQKPLREIASVRGRHFVLTLHGVRGTEQSFGQFHSVIKDVLERIDPGYEVKPINFTYTVGSNDFDPNLVTPEINRALERELGELRDNDRISVLAYSMGGQVGLVWYTNAIKDPQFAPIAEKVETFFSLGAPYWGSKEAVIGENIPSLDAALSIAPIEAAAHLGGNEVRGLAMGSATTHQLRQARLQIESTPELRARARARFVSLAGVVPFIRPADPSSSIFSRIATKVSNWVNGGLTQVTFGGDRRETDSVVTVPSANANFLYAVDLSKAYPAGSLTPAAQFIDLTERHPDSRLIASEVIHATLDPSKVSDMVVIPEKCRDPHSCDHPIFKNIVLELADCKSALASCDRETAKEVFSAYFHEAPESAAIKEKQFAQTLRGFMLELNLRLPKGFKLPADLNARNILSYIQFDYEEPNFVDFAHALTLNAATDGLLRQRFPDYVVHVARAKEVNSRVVKLFTDTPDGLPHLRVILTGLLLPSDSSQASQNKFLPAIAGGVEVPFRIRLPGLKERSVEAKVKTATSTYLDVVLAP